MRFLTCVYSNPGGRTPNEDSAGSFSKGDFHAWIAADGLGGHSYGKIASRTARDNLEEALFNCAEMDAGFVKETFKKMNESVRALRGPLTTAVCAFSDGNKLFYGNNGDSRFVFIRGKKLQHRTNDHSLAFLAYAKGEIPYDEIAAHPSQNRLYHSLGNEIEFCAEFYEAIDLQPGDAFLLCTDGFWELVKESEIVRTLNISPTADEWVRMLLECLEPRLKPTSDNYTVVCVKVLAD